MVDTSKAIDVDSYLASKAEEFSMGNLPLNEFVEITDYVQEVLEDLYEATIMRKAEVVHDMGRHWVQVTFMVQGEQVAGVRLPLSTVETAMGGKFVVRDDAWATLSSTSKVRLRTYWRDGEARLWKVYAIDKNISGDVELRNVFNLHAAIYVPRTSFPGTEFHFCGDTLPAMAGSGQIWMHDETKDEYEVVNRSGETVVLRRVHDSKVRHSTDQGLLNHFTKKTGIAGSPLPRQDHVHDVQLSRSDHTHTRKP